MPYEDGQTIANMVVSVAASWYESKRAKSGRVNFNVIAVGLAVSRFVGTCEHPIKESDIAAGSGEQVRGLNADFIRGIMARHALAGKIPAEGGRTSRGSLRLAKELVGLVNEALADSSHDAFTCGAVQDALEDYFVARLEEDYFNRQRLEVPIDVSKPVSSIVADIIAVARSRSDKPTGAVVQHLVGAKLELRFPDLEVGRDRANAADQQTNRMGDFQLGTTAFHVTVSPMVKLIGRARDNIREGFLPMVLVPEDKVDFAHGMFASEDDLATRVGVQSIETFVGTNIEEIASYDLASVRRTVAMLIRRYNERIEDAETDMSLRIAEPQWIREIMDPGGPS